MRLGWWLGLLGACNSVERSCERYREAANTCTSDICANEPTCEDAVELDASYCDPYRDLKGADAKASTEVLDCGSDAYEAADCSTVDGYLEAASAVDDCST